MLSEKNLKDLKLSEKQLQKYRELEKNERILRSALKKCGVSQNAVEKIIKKSDLNKIDINNLEALEEDIRETWKDFILQR